MVSGFERGSEVVQFVVAIFVLLLLVFSSLQIGGMTLSANRVSLDVLRAGRQLDTMGVERAVDKGEFVKDRIVEESNQLVADNLRVDHVVCSSMRVDRGHTVEEQGSISQRVEGMAVSFDLSYEMPSFIDLPGLSGQTLERHVECVRAGRSVVEVEMTAL